jgi:prefoldin subunit 5
MAKVEIGYWKLVQTFASLIADGMQKLLPLLLFLLLLAACENREAVKALQAETEAVHDEAMKDMAELNRTGRALRHALTELDSTDAATPARREAMERALVAIETADSNMMSWMAGYQAPNDLPVDEALSYLQQQKEAIEANHREIRAAIEAGKAAQQ